MSNRPIETLAAVRLTPRDVNGATDLLQREIDDQEQCGNADRDRDQHSIVELLTLRCVTNVEHGLRSDIDTHRHPQECNCRSRPQNDDGLIVADRDLGILLGYHTSTTICTADILMATAHHNRHQ